MVKRIFLALAGLLVPMLLVIAFNTFRFESKQPDFQPATLINVDLEGAALRLSHAIQLQTISHQNSAQFNAEPFQHLIRQIAGSFPNIEAGLSKTIINDYSVVYKWQGSNDALQPIAFLAHLDVVPPEPGTDDQWHYKPFSGAIEEGFIWGRGSLDDKSSVFGVLEAVEHLIAQGFRPQRSVYLAFGHDEEIGGLDGAAKIANYFKQNNERLLFTLDEGMVIVNEDLSPAQQMTGIIGIAEKGYTNLKLTARAQGGHSSMPPPTGAVGMLARAITALEDNPMGSTLSGPSGQLFDYIGPEMGWVKKALFANRWLFDGVIATILEAKTSTAAMIRTTTAVTMMSGGVKENVLPSHASAVANFRILPGDSSADVLQHVTAVVGNPNVSVEFLRTGPQQEASRISATDTAEFAAIGSSIQQVFEGALVAPGLVLAGTDSKHYESVADNNYRFAPYTFGPDDLGRVHGINERIAVADYGKMIQFYAQLIKNVDAL